MRRGSLRRLGLEQIALGQLHWSVAKYAPPLERVLWEGLAGMYEQVACAPRLRHFTLFSHSHSRDPLESVLIGSHACSETSSQLGQVLGHQS